MLEMLAAFVFIINQDPMTDARTYEARISQGRSHVSVLCGASTGGKVAIEFQADRELAIYSDQRASVEWRFDYGTSEKAWANWFGDRATLVDEEADAFAAKAAKALRIRTRIRAYDGEFVLFEAGPIINGEVIDRVLTVCAQQ